MKIGVIGKFGPEELGGYISFELKKMNYQVYEFEFGIFYNQENKKNTLNKIKRKIFDLGILSSKKSRQKLLKKFVDNIIENGPFDLIISTYDYLSYLEISEIKDKTKAKVILWYPDGLVNTGKAFFLTAGYDKLFFKCKHIVEQLKNFYELDVHYMPEAYSESLEVIGYNEEFSDIDIAIAGNLHSSRIPLLEKLVALNKYNIKIFGTEAPFYFPVSENLKKCITGKYIVGKEKRELFKNVKINLNTLHIGEVRSLNVRTFEINGAGGFQLISYKPEIEEFFKIGDEIESFKTFEELVEKIDFYLDNDSLRKQIAENGYKRNKNNTYEKRLNKILRICGF